MSKGESISEEDKSKLLGINIKTPDGAFDSVMAVLNPGDDGKFHPRSIVVNHTGNTKGTVVIVTDEKNNWSVAGKQLVQNLNKLKIWEAYLW